MAKKQLLSQIKLLEDELTQIKEVHANLITDITNKERISLEADLKEMAERQAEERIQTEKKLKKMLKIADFQNEMLLEMVICYMF